MKPNRSKDSKRRHSFLGQSLVELAIILPLFLLLLFGIIEFGRALYQWYALYRAAWSGARTAAMAAASQIDSVGRTTARDILIPYGFQDPPTTINVDFPNLNAEPITVTVSRPFNSAVAGLFPGLSPIMLTGRHSSFWAHRTSHLSPPTVPSPGSTSGSSSSGTTSGSGSSGSTSGSGSGSTSGSGSGTTTGSGSSGSTSGSGSSGSTSGSGSSGTSGNDHPEF